MTQETTTSESSAKKEGEPSSYMNSRYQQIVFARLKSGGDELKTWYYGGPRKLVL